MLSGQFLKVSPTLFTSFDLQEHVFTKFCLKNKALSSIFPLRNHKQIPFEMFTTNGKTLISINFCKEDAKRLYVRQMILLMKLFEVFYLFLCFCHKCVLITRLF